MEREVHDMYGIRFAGNDDLRPILLYEGFEGHPLRKDYAMEHGAADRAVPEVAGDAVPRHPSAARSSTRPTRTTSSSTSGRRTRRRTARSRSSPNWTARRSMRADVHCGYLHRGFEKEAEHHTYHNVIPYTDRLNYCSALNNNFAYADAVELAAGHRDHAALRRAAHAALRVQPHRRPLHLHRRLGHGNGRHDRVPVPDDGARLHLRAHEPPLRARGSRIRTCASAAWRATCRTAGWCGSRRSCSSPSSTSSASTACSTATGSSSAARATWRR